MKLLLCKNVSPLGIVGDVVDVSAGYARNYLVPHGLATEPTQTNMRRLAKARREAEKERAAEHSRLEALAERMKSVEVTIHAKANEEGHLYGSVNKREIAAALETEGYFVKPEQVILEAPIRHLDTVMVDLRLVDDVRTSIKVWVVREKEEGEEDEEEAETGTEADPASRAEMNDDGADD